VTSSSAAFEIITLDLSFCSLPHTIASYLVLGPDRAVLVETGPASTLESLTAGLADHGVDPKDIDDVLVTHIHLDHAGAAGWWARQGARVHVHHVGAPHLVDPERLLRSAGRIYGDMIDRLWGQTQPAPSEQVFEVRDGDVIPAGGLEFTAIETPGHAGHHHVYRLGDVGFSGDAAGIRLPGNSFVALPTPPPEFDLQTWVASADRLANEGFAAVYPTHFGCIDDPGEHFTVVGSLLHETTEFVARRLRDGMGRDTLVRDYMRWNRERAAREGVSASDLMRYECVNPSAMSVDGIVRHLGKTGAH
jgi:glyoxylase-like metal-dependent hydrolase (beta-lactamase superfamily II)